LTRLHPHPVTAQSISSTPPTATSSPFSTPSSSPSGWRYVPSSSLPSAHLSLTSSPPLSPRPSNETAPQILHSSVLLRAVSDREVIGVAGAATTGAGAGGDEAGATAVRIEQDGREGKGRVILTVVAPVAVFCFGSLSPSLTHNRHLFITRSTHAFHRLAYLSHSHRSRPSFSSFFVFFVLRFLSPVVTSFFAQAFFRTFLLCCLPLGGNEERE
jgi:hypothetical protein